MPKFLLLGPCLLGASLLLLATAAPVQAQDHKAGHAAQQATPEANSTLAAPLAPAVTRRTDAHTINVTMDSGPADERTTPKIGAPSGQQPGNASSNGLPPAVDAGTFLPLPATAQPQKGMRSQLLSR